MERSGIARRALARVGATVAVALSGFLAVPAAQAEEGTAPMAPGSTSAVPHATQSFDGEYVTVGGASIFAGNCFNARNITVGSAQYRDCGVERAALNITGDVLTRYHQENLYLGNSFNVRGGTINLAGGVYEGNNFVANTIIIRGNALFVGRNTFEGEVFVKDPDQIAGEVFFVDEITPTHADAIAADVDNLVNCTNTLLDPQAFGRLDTEGEFINSTMNGEVGIHNLIAAGNNTDEFGRCAQTLSASEFAHFSAIATVDGPRNVSASGTITHAELELFHRELQECGDQMNAARPQSPGAAVGALLDCGESMTVTSKATHQ
ncbi:hypothetical protein [Streptomyces sp. NBC_01092]|uniref:hypothetical protein n=1 Tax=Streptomyces sp. NBC_01092 TaxID=2903748 RepID=UPI00386CA2AB|nr:hypothetical protein OG254_25510 [Streptomyces sp. NBC_01092]